MKRYFAALLVTSCCHCPPERDALNILHPRVGESIPSADECELCEYIGDGDYECVEVTPTPKWCD